MMDRTQISLDRELQRRARAKASQMGISLAEYIRRLLTEDLAGHNGAADPSLVFNLGDSGGSNIARFKDQMVAEAFDKKGRDS